MNRTKNKITVLLSAFCFMLLTGCAVTETVNYDPTANFSEFQTFGFYQENPAAEQDIAAGNYNTLLDQYLKSAIRQTLSAQEGLTYDATNPDLKVAYDVSVDTETNVNTNYAFAPGFGYGYSYWYGYRYNYGFNNFPTAYRTINQYKEGTVVVDLVNAETNELVWRGVGEAVVDMTGNISQETINQIISEVLEEYPPKNN
ncbi:uncharacterized protein DUF4136 [Pontibacter ummariensis]|uniref:DUF4136 domain-containing protein n=1 Tax=Pontibacter ummariensis TaxID=1610492 RepID=A0A239CY81_9BACT|nr:DUF4136 domain-containing protein [Pontibacter ummariensis]PRY14766.1 uncharacterized protein DUF4136 [Pontibacter ummariensis]SNS24899.1 protein of unknown function [Pontibacter ummariensis]